MSLTIEINGTRNKACEMALDHAYGEILSEDAGIQHRGERTYKELVDHFKSCGYRVFRNNQGEHMVIEVA